jgi:hypothetical protein
MPVTFNNRTIFPFPSYPPAPANIDWTAYDAVATSVSPFTGQLQLQNWNSSWLEGSFQLPPLRGNPAQQWIAFLESLQGQTGCFQLGDPRFTAPQSGYSGSPTVAATAASGYNLTLNIPGGALRVGDLIQIGYRMYRVTSEANGALTIWPNIRESIPSGAAVVLQNCVGLWCLKDAKRSWSLGLQRVYGFNVDFREAI